MDKKTITGFILIALVLFGFAWWQQPSKEQLEQQQKEAQLDSIAAAKKNVVRTDWRNLDIKTN